MMSGCGHAGMMNTALKFQQIENKDVFGAIGGFHLFRSLKEDITKTSKSLKSSVLSNWLVDTAQVYTFKDHSRYSFNF